MREGPSRLERIHILLDSYLDVISGLRDRQGDGVHLPLMCRAWRRPHLGYPELDRLLGLMKDEQPSLYWHLAETYFRSYTRRVLVCANPRCEVTYPSWVKISFHSHGRRAVPLVPQVRRVTSPRVDAGLVRDAIAWLDAGWAGDPELPSELWPKSKVA